MNPPINKLCYNTIFANIRVLLNNIICDNYFGDHTSSTKTIPCNTLSYLSAPWYPLLEERQLLGEVITSEGLSDDPVHVTTTSSSVVIHYPQWIRGY